MPTTVRPVRLRVGRHAANSEVGSQILSLASRSDRGKETIEAESRFVHHAWRKRMSVTQHGASIVDHLREELVG